MTDDEFLATSIEHRSTRAKGKAILAKADKLQEQLLAEIRRRRCKVLTSKGNLIDGFGARGVKIMRLAQITTVYNVDKAKVRLKPGVVRKLVRPVITKDAIDDALAAGIITKEDVDAIAETAQGGEWVNTYGTLEAA